MAGDALRLGPMYRSKAYDLPHALFLLLWIVQYVCRAGLQPRSMLAKTPEVARKWKILLL